MCRTVCTCIIDNLEKEKRTCTLGSTYHHVLIKIRNHVLIKI